MADELANHTLHLLREMREESNRRPEEMRDEAAAFRKEVNTRFDAMDRRFDGVDKRLSEMEVSLAAARTDQHRTNELLEIVAETQKNQGARANVIKGD